MFQVTPMWNTWGMTWNITNHCSLFVSHNSAQFCNHPMTKFLRQTFPVTAYLRGWLVSGGSFMSWATWLLAFPAESRKTVVRVREKVCILWGLLNYFNCLFICFFLGTFVFSCAPPKNKQTNSRSNSFIQTNVSTECHQHIEEQNNSSLVF